jgi:hypothetical protein
MIRINKNDKYFISLIKLKPNNIFKCSNLISIVLWSTSNNSQLINLTKCQMNISKTKECWLLAMIVMIINPQSQRLMNNNQHSLTLLKFNTRKFQNLIDSPENQKITTKILVQNWPITSKRTLMNLFKSNCNLFSISKIKSITKKNSKCYANQNLAKLSHNLSSKTTGGPKTLLMMI